MSQGHAAMWSCELFPPTPSSENIMFTPSRSHPQAIFLAGMLQRLHTQIYVLHKQPRAAVCLSGRILSPFQRSVTSSIMGIFQCYQLAEERRRRIMGKGNLKGERETDGAAYEGADRGSDRCSGPEEARTCDWWITGSSYWHALLEKKKTGYHGYWGRLQEKRIGVKPT